MKKIYSFVLMAAMLLVGTNVNAGNVSSAAALKLAFQNAHDGDVISLTQPLSVEDQLVLNLVDGGKVVLDLTNGDLEMACTFPSNDAAIKVVKGTLEIQGGEITAAGTNIYDLIRVIGDYNTGIDAATQTPYSQVIVKSGATITSEGQKNALTICENATKVDSKSYANGARIDVYGHVKGQKYGIKVNGTIQRPAKDEDAPYVYIHAGAIVETSQAATDAVAAYSSGYGRWRIEGNCTGSTGLYAKSGDVDIVGNATITSNNTSGTVAETGKGSGVNAGGSAIVIESNANYPGQTSVTISDNATITGKSGYAIEETVDETVAATPEGTKVSSISIQGGTINAGTSGAVIVDQKTKEGNVVSVVGGTVEGTIKVGDPEKPTTISQTTINTLINGSTTDDPAVAADYLVQQTNTGKGYSVKPNLSKVVTMNGNGFATFSATFARQIYNAEVTDHNEGLKVYYASSTGDDAETADDAVLKLTEITDGVIPANTGVVFIGTADKAYALGTNSGADALANNLLKPATAWSTSEPDANGIIAGTPHDYAYVLVGGLLYKYTGADMKDHKAYLDLEDHYATPNGAPARVRMIIEETQAVENVEVEAIKAIKFIENGQVLIKRGEKVYNVQGQIVK